MELVTIEGKLPKEVYDRASEILAKQGLSREDALILFLKETVRLGRIPFDYTEEDLEEAQKWERMRAAIFCIWQELRGIGQWKPLNSTSP